MASWTLGDGSIPQEGSGPEEFRPRLQGLNCDASVNGAAKVLQAGTSEQRAPARVSAPHLGKGRKTPWELGMVPGTCKDTYG